MCFEEGRLVSHQRVRRTVTLVEPVAREFNDQIPDVFRIFLR